MSVLSLFKVPAWCNALDGLYPGYSCDDQVDILDESYKTEPFQLLCGYTSGDCTQRDYSAFLEKLNNNPEREAAHM